MTLILDKDNPLATKVQTKDGRKARLICVDRKDRAYPIVALIDIEASEVACAFTTNGHFFKEGSDPEKDLINASVTIKRWVNLYKNTDGQIYPGAGWFETRAEADSAATHVPADRVACKEIEITEGEGL